MLNYATTVALIGWCLLPGLSHVGAETPLPAFSADFVSAPPGGQPTRRGHIYVSGSRVRIEAPDFADGFFLVDGDSRAAWFVRPRQQVFMAAKQSSPLTQLLISVDPHDACRQWRAMQIVAGDMDEWQCQRLGDEVADGRETMKYESRSRRGGRSYRWVDPAHGFPVRIEGGDGRIATVEHFVDAPQPARLFTIPPEYHLFDPAQLIQQIKQSDVWVEPPP